MKRVHIITDNSKGVGPNISLRPVLDCPNCSHCSLECYALKAYRQYPEVKTAWTDNAILARENPAEFFQQVREYLASTCPRSFRIHVAGDFFSQDYLDAWKRVADDFPRIAFLAFTKCYWLDFSGRPTNLEIVFSIWPEMPMPKRQTGIRFAFCDDGTDDARIPAEHIPCFGKCSDCGVCWNLSQIGQDVVFQIH